MFNFEPIVSNTFYVDYRVNTNFAIAPSWRIYVLLIYIPTGRDSKMHSSMNRTCFPEKQPTGCTNEMNYRTVLSQFLACGLSCVLLNVESMCKNIRLLLYKLMWKCIMIYLRNIRWILLTLPQIIYLYCVDSDIISYKSILSSRRFTRVW